MAKVKDGLPIENLTKDTPIERVSEAIGESARRLREEHGVHPLTAFNEAYRRAKDRTGRTLSDRGDM